MVVQEEFSGEDTQRRCEQAGGAIGMTAGAATGEQSRPALNVLEVAGC